MYALWCEADSRVTVHASSLAGGTPLIRDDNTASLSAAETWLVGWGFLTVEPWEPVAGDPGRLRAPLARRLVAVR